MKKNLFSIALVVALATAFAQVSYTAPSQLIGHKVSISPTVDPAEVFSNRVFTLHHKKMEPISQFSSTPGYEFEVENPFIYRKKTYVCFRSPNQRFWVRYDELDSLLPHLVPAEPWESWFNQLRHNAHYYDAHSTRHIFFCPDSLLVSNRYLPLEWISYATGPDSTPAYAIVRTGHSTLQAVLFSSISRALSSSHFLPSPAPRRAGATTTPPVMSGSVTVTNDLLSVPAPHMADTLVLSEALLQHVATNIRYPISAIMQNISGTVEVSFVVEKDGTISSAIVPHDIGGGCGQEALRIIMTLPQQKNIQRRIICSTPIHFNLR